MNSKVSLVLLLVAFGFGYWLNFDLRSPDPRSILDSRTQENINPNRSKFYLDQEFSDLGGTLVPLKKWNANFTVINFWGTWCPPCKKEMPLLSRLSQKFKSQNVQFIGVALDDPESVKSFLETHDVAFPILWGSADVSLFMSDLGNNFGSLPFTAVIDSQNTILFTQLGEVEEEPFSEELEKLIKSM